MRHRKGIAALALGASLLCLPAFSQEESVGRSEVSVQMFGTFTRNTVQDGINQASRNSGGILASYRFFFADHQGIEFNYGASRTTESYNFGSGLEGINANEHELTAAYVVRWQKGRISPFVEGGGGALIFDPRHFARASTDAELALVYGAGADYNVTKRIFFRAEYRGLIYQTPTFGNSGCNRFAHRAEPSVGFGYRF
jgi:opacity protein-like surface antigen